MPDGTARRHPQGWVVPQLRPRSCLANFLRSFRRGVESARYPKSKSERRMVLPHRRGLRGFVYFHETDARGVVGAAELDRVRARTQGHQQGAIARIRHQGQRADVRERVRKGRAGDGHGRWGRDLLDRDGDLPRQAKVQIRRRTAAARELSARTCNGVLTDRLPSSRVGFPIVDEHSGLPRSSRLRPAPAVRSGAGRRTRRGIRPTAREPIDAGPGWRGSRCHDRRFCGGRRRPEENSAAGGSSGHGTATLLLSAADLLAAVKAGRVGVQIATVTRPAGEWRRFRSRLGQPPLHSRRRGEGRGNLWPDAGMVD